MGLESITQASMNMYPSDSESLQIALSAMPVGVSWARLEDQRILYVNQKFTEMFGYALEHLGTLDEWVEMAYASEVDREVVERRWGRYLTESEQSEFKTEPVEVVIRCRNGSLKTVILSGVILPRLGWVLATFVDISGRKLDETALIEAERKAAENQSIHRLLLDHSSEMIVLAPFDGSKRFVSAAVEHITGFTPEEYLQLDRFNFVHPDDVDEARMVVKQIRAGELRQVFRYRTRQKKGGYQWVEATITGYLNPVTGKPAGYVATIRDIGQEKEREERAAANFQRLAEEASLDSLTGIANRRSFSRALEMQAQRHLRSRRDLSLMLIDVDFFKKFNDRYGHLAGDECLKAIAGALQGNVRRDSDVVARFGGEEFVIMMPNTDRSGSAIVAAKIVNAVAALAVPHRDAPDGVVSVSVGVSTGSAGEPLDTSLLLQYADRALYVAKEQGRNRFILSTEKPPPASL